MASSNPASEISTAAMVAATTASHLPRTTAPRLTGLTSSASRDPRSRSPAVASMARCSPPTKTDMRRKSGIMESTLAAVFSGVARSTSTRSSGATSVGLTPRAIIRSALIRRR